jgi:hypothetical protein
MKRSLLIFAVISLFFVYEQAVAQSLQVGVGGGLTVLTNEEATTSFADGGFGLGTGYNYGAKLKVGIPLLPFNVTAGAFWHPLKSEEEVVDLKYSFDQTLSNYSLGVEMVLFPGPLKPYLSAELLQTTFGEATYKIDEVGDEKYDSFTRQGFALGVGATFTLLPIIDVDLAAKYQMNKMFGKKDEEDNYNSFVVTATVYFDVL